MIARAAGSNTQATDEPTGPGPVLADLAKQADYPRDAMAMIDACPMEMRVGECVAGVER